MPLVTMPDGAVVDMPDSLTPELAARLRSLNDAGNKTTDAENPTFYQKYTKPLVQSTLHNTEKQFHSAANILEQGAAGLALAAAPDSGFAQSLGNQAISDQEAQKQWESKYQQKVPDSAASYTGATVGSIAPFMMGGISAGLKATGEAGGMVGKLFPEIMQKYMSGVGSSVAQGGAIGAATAPSLNDVPKSAGVGAAFGAGLGGVIAPLVDVGKNIIAPLISNSAAESGAAKQLIQVSGDDAKAVAKKLIEGQPVDQSQIETAAQQLSDLNNPKISALQKYWQSNFGSTSAYRNESAQRDLEVARLKFLGAEKAPQRQAAIDEANRVTKAFELAKSKGTSYQEEAANLVSKVRHVEDLSASAAEQSIMLDSASQAQSIAAGNPRVGGRNVSRAQELIDVANRESDKAAEQSLKAGASARLAEGIVGSMEQRGLKPLDANSFIDSITNVMNKPENVVNDSMRLLGTRIVRAVNRASDASGGTLDAASLDALRRTAINDFIDSASKGNPSQAKKLASNEATQSFKRFIDDAIEGAGGVGYKDYMIKYSAARKEIEAPLLRMDTSNEMAKTATTEIARIMNDQKIHGIGILDKAVSITQSVLRGMQGIAGSRVGRVGAEMMTNEPKQLGGLMQKELERNGNMFTPNKLQMLIPSANNMLTGQQQ